MKQQLRILAISIILIIALVPLLSSGQGWERYNISNSGCSALFPSEPAWELSYAVDSSLIWTAEVYESDIFFGVICVEFSLPFIEEGTTEDDLVAVAESYLDYLRAEFNITTHTGYETGAWMESNNEATGISDSWTDAEDDPWYVMTWIDPYNMVVMYMYTVPTISMDDYKSYFFNSFRFPH
jgi:hypothetical protein